MSKTNQDIALLQRALIAYADSLPTGHEIQRVARTANKALGAAKRRGLRVDFFKQANGNPEFLQRFVAFCNDRGVGWERIGHELQIWKTLRIGGMGKRALLKEFEERGLGVGGWARDAIDQKEFVTTRRSKEIQLVKTSLRSLGFRPSFTGEPTTTRIFARAQELGLKRCPAEVGPHLCLAYVDQPKGETLYIGMEPIVIDPDGDPLPPLYFSVVHGGGGLGLRWILAGPEAKWDFDAEFVFEKSS